MPVDVEGVYDLPYRQTIGFAQSIFDLLYAEVEMPDYTLFADRKPMLQVLHCLK